VGVLSPTFKRYERRSFELKVRRNAWPAGALPRTSLGDLTALPENSLARLRALLLWGMEGSGGKVDVGEGKGKGSAGLVERNLHAKNQLDLFIHFDL